MKNKNKQTKQNIFVSAKQGFSLIETMISVFIFSLIAVLLAGAFSGFLKNVATSKKAQRNAESAQYVMNLIAKTIRSSAMNPSSLTTANQITMFDNSQNKCLIYKYEEFKVKIGTADAADLTACNFGTITLTDLTSVNEIASMTFSGTTVSVGKITIKIEIAGDGPVESRTLQSTVSLR